MIARLLKGVPMVALVAVILAYAGAAVASLPGYTQVVGISTDANTVQAQAATQATWSQSNTVSSTTVVLVAPLTGRSYVEIRSGPTAGQEIWVGIDSVPAVGTGLMVTPSQPFKGNVPAGVTVKTIASGAFTMCVLQAAY